jgi:O-antigen/teichoic acid export membrane protein
VRTFFQVAFGLLQTNEFGLIYGLVAGQVAGTLVALAYTICDRSQLTDVRLSRALRVFFEQKNFALFGLLPELFQRLAVHLPSVLLAVLGSYEAAGIYVFSQRFFGIPHTVYVSSVAKVYFAEGARLNGSDTISVEALFRHTLRRTIAYTLPLYLMVMAVSPWLFSAVFPEPWAAAGLACGLLAPMFLSRLLYDTLRPTADLLGRPHLQTINAVVAIAAFVPSLLLPSFLNWGTTSTLACMSLGVACGQIASIAILSAAISKVQAEDLVTLQTKVAA